MIYLTSPHWSSALDTTAAIDRFLAQVEKRAFRMAYIATSSHDDALDIVQDAMIKLVKHYRERDEDELPRLFHRILQNQIRDWYRRSKVRNSLQFFLGGSLKEGQDQSEDPIQQLPEEGHRQPVDLLADEKAMIQLDDALQNLPIRQQQAFLLRTLEGLDVASTAQAMGCSTGSVKTHYSRAVHKLRDLLGEHWL